MYFWYCTVQCIHSKNIEYNNQESIGIFDEPAQEILEQYTFIDNPSVDDIFTKNKIIELNRYEGSVNDHESFNEIIKDYEKVINNDDYIDDISWNQLDQLENFMQRNKDIMLDNHQYNDFIENALNIRPKKLAETIENVKSENDTKVESVNKYIEDNVTFTSDSQNVHDSSVNCQLRNTVNSLKKQNPSIQSGRKSTKKELVDYINNLENLDSTKRKLALYSLDTIEKGAFNDSIDTKEDHLLDLVWDRAKIPQNQDNSELIKEAIVDSLIDMSSEYHGLNGSNQSGINVVCSSGRTARLLSSLATLDPVTDGFLTVEQIRNDALKKSQDILQDTIKMYSSENDSQEMPVSPELATVARSYNSVELLETDPKAEQQFKDIVISKINNEIDTSFKSKLSEKDYQNISEQCTSAILSI
jgi:hypothetical protein